ncbi:MAG: undecaprenyldiphospho-muramoylpentapeptide beta-N-acetylglucosaminyltransferase [Bacteroidota bacterium]
MSKQIKPKIIISGGGTGGHVYPAISIADAIKNIKPEADILFVGAKGKIEMEKVPRAGYPIKGLWISGFHRKLTLRNLMFPIKLVSSLVSAWSILRRFKPNLVIGVGGFASGPVLEVASRMGKPSLIQEQNSYPGITNKLLAKKVNKICVAYDGLERFFPAEKIIQTGNPVRTAFFEKTVDKNEAYRHFGLNPNLKTIFVFGGSLGASSINQAMAANAGKIEGNQGVQILWQVGKLYEEKYQESATAKAMNVRMLPFVDRMDLAFAIADLTICRAGAGTISELCLVGQAAILIPSPNVAEDHQTKNAQALVEKLAARLVADRDAKDKIIDEAFELLANEEDLKDLEINIKKLAKPKAAEVIATEALKLIN